MNLVLIGYRGTGKTTLSIMLSERLHLPVCHMDEMLESRFGARIADFVQRHGWDAFRDEESLLVEELGGMDKLIIDSGGGVILRESNVHHLRRNGWVAWLQAEPDSIAKNIGADTNRPPLTDKPSAVDEIHEVLAARIPLYQAAADFIIQTDALSLDECGDQICAAWKNHLQT